MNLNGKFIMLLFLVALTLGGCRKGPSATYDNSKRIKRGKPVPCPIKDC